jgi:Holliday junction resolvase RusA-like endonuclease
VGKKPWPFGLAIRMWFPVQRFATGDALKIRRNDEGIPRIAPREEVFAYRKYLAVRCRQEIFSLRKDPAMAELEFPIETHEVRLDLMFGFRVRDRGEQRMKATDIDNLRKTTQDAFKGILYVNDSIITEGFTGKGYAPPQLEGDIVWLIISRAGYRGWEKMDELFRAITPYPPWLAKQQDRVIVPAGGLVIPSPGGCLPGSPLSKNH